MLVREPTTSSSLLRSCTARKSDNEKGMGAQIDPRRVEVYFQWRRRGLTMGRFLVVVFDPPTPSGLAYCVTARPMTERERRDYEGTVR